MASAQEKQRLQAARIAARSEIRDVRLTEGEFKFHSFPQVGQLAYDLSIGTAELDWDTDDAGFSVALEYKLTLGEQPPEDEAESDSNPGREPHTIANFRFVYAGLFALNMRDGDEPPTEEELVAYANTTASFALYPFVREYVYAMTGRLRLPSLTLGVLLQPLSEDEVTSGVVEG